MKVSPHAITSASAAAHLTYKENPFAYQENNIFPSVRFIWNIHFRPPAGKSDKSLAVFRRTPPFPKECDNCCDKT